MKRGFSLVELLIVMAIVAILAAVAVPGAAGMMEIADARRDGANALLIADSINTYNSLHPGDRLIDKPDAWTDVAVAVGDMWPRGLSAARAEAAYAMVTIKNGRASVPGGDAR